jgi:hypothetical protein
MAECFEGYADTVMGMYNHSTSSSATPLYQEEIILIFIQFIYKWNFNNVPYTYLGHKTVLVTGTLLTALLD